MRGNVLPQGAMFSYLSPEARVPKDHPLRPLKQMVNRARRELSPPTSRPCIPGRDVRPFPRKRGNFRLDEDRGPSPEGPAPGHKLAGFMFTLTAAAYHLVRMRNLTAAVSPGTEKAPGNAVILPATGHRRSKRTGFFNELARHQVPTPS